MGERVKEMMIVREVGNNLGDRRLYFLFLVVIE